MLANFGLYIQSSGKMRLEISTDSGFRMTYFGDSIVPESSEVTLLLPDRAMAISGSLLIESDSFEFRSEYGDGRISHYEGQWNRSEVVEAALKKFESMGPVGEIIKTMLRRYINGGK